MLGHETRDLGAMIVQQGYKSSFMILYGHSRLDRPNEKFCWVYVRLTTHSHGSKNVWLCRFESYVAKRFKILHEFLSLYDIRLVISFFQIGCEVEKLVLWMS